MLNSNGSILIEKCNNITLAKPSVYEDNCGIIPQQSNGSVFIENCVALTDWTDTSAGDGAVSVVTYKEKEVFKLDSGTAGSGNDAEITQDVGTFGNRVVATIKLNSSLLGTKSNNDHLALQVARAGVRLLVGFASDGLFIYDGVAWNEVGTNLVQLNTDQTWTFDCDFSTPASATCDVYLNGILKASGVDCSYTGSFTEGQVNLRQYGYTLANCITYVDKVEIGDDLVTNSIDTWDDVDNGTNAESSQVTLQGDSCFKFDSGDQSGSNYAFRRKDIGSFDTEAVFSISIYHETLGTLGDGDCFLLTAQITTRKLLIIFATDGLYVYNSGTPYEVGTNLVQVGALQEWTFDVNFSTSKVDVYLGGILQASAVDCYHSHTGNNGLVQLVQYGYATANRISYVKDIKIGDEFLWEDGDLGTGESTQVTYLTKSRFKFTNAGGTGNSNRPIRTHYFNVLTLGDRAVVSFDINFDAIGTYASGNYAVCTVYHQDVALSIRFATDNIYIYDGSIWQAIINLVVLDIDQVYTFDCDFSTPASATVDIYLDGVLKIAGVDCSYVLSGSPRVQFSFYDTSTINQIFYVNNLQIGDSLKGIIADKETYYDDCSSLTGWTNSSSGTGSTTLDTTTFSGRDTFKLTSGASAGASNYGYILRDAGSFDDITIATMEAYFETLGTLANDDRFIIQFIRADVRCILSFTSDGVYVYDGAAHNLVINSLTQDIFGKWTFVIDFTIPASATIDIYLNDALLAEGADCSDTGTFTEGEIKIFQHGDTTVNCTTYIDDLRIGTELLGDRLDYEYIPGYTETDPNSRITIDLYKVTVAGLLKNEDAYVYKDYGVGCFDGDFEFLVECKATAHTNNGQESILSLANAVDDWQGIFAANAPQLSVQLEYSSTTYRIQLVECYNGTAYTDSYDCSVDTTYYLRFVRSETEGTYGTLYCFIYSDKDRTLLLDILELVLHEKTDYRYLYSAQSRNSGDVYSISGWSQDISRFGEEGSSSSSISSLSLSSSSSSISSSSISSSSSSSSISSSSSSSSISFSSSSSSTSSSSSSSSSSISSSSSSSSISSSSSSSSSSISSSSSSSSSSISSSSSSSSSSISFSSISSSSSSSSSSISSSSISSSSSSSSISSSSSSSSISSSSSNSSSMSSSSFYYEKSCVLPAELYIPQGLRGTEFWEEWRKMTQYILNGEWSDFTNIQKKYRDYRSLDLDAMRAVIREFGYGYFLDTMDLDGTQTRAIMAYLHLLHILKGQRKGLELALRLFNLSYSIIEWWEVAHNPSIWPFIYGITNTPGYYTNVNMYTCGGVTGGYGEPYTFHLILYAEDSQIMANTIENLRAFIRQYVYPTLSRFELRTLFDETVIWGSLDDSYYEDTFGSSSSSSSSISSSSISSSSSSFILPVYPGRGIFGGGSSVTNVIDYVTISTTGDATDFGDLTTAKYGLGATSNGTNERGILGGGNGPINVIDYITISTTGNATDFGDLTLARYKLAATSSGTNDRGVFGGGSNITNVIDYVTISTTGDATDFGDLTGARYDLAATSNDTGDRGVFSGGNNGSSVINVIDYVTISTTGNATDFGDLTTSRSYLAATSNGTNDRGVFGGGYTGIVNNVMDYITITSTGDASDFGDLTEARYALAATSNGTADRGIFGGGSSVTNVIDYVTISTVGDAINFGDLTEARYSLAATSNGAS